MDYFYVFYNILKYHLSLKKLTTVSKLYWTEKYIIKFIKVKNCMKAMQGCKYFQINTKYNLKNVKH